MIFLWYWRFIVRYRMIFDIVCLFFDIKGNINIWYRYLNISYIWYRYLNISYVMYDIVHYVSYLILCLYAGAMLHYKKDSTTYGVARDVVPLFQDEDNNSLINKLGIYILDKLCMFQNMQEAHVQGRLPFSISNIKHGVHYRIQYRVRCYLYRTRYCIWFRYTI